MELYELEHNFKYADRMYKSYLGYWKDKSDFWFEKREQARKELREHLKSLGFKREQKESLPFVPMSDWTEHFENYGD